MVNRRETLRQAQRWVVKVGSALITDDGRGLARDQISAWADQVAALRKAGRQVTLVSSGAVAEGMQRLGWRTRPRAVYQLQAAAGVGQSGLVHAWSEGLDRHALQTAQVLLTHDDLSDRRRYLNARSALREMLRLGVVPVVNENDTVVTDEIRFGDNDTLAALVANLVEAEALVVLTDQPGLMDRDPRVHPDAVLLDEVRAGDPELERLCGSTAGVLGRGGMLTKVRGAERAARSGTYTVVASGHEPRVIQRLVEAERGLGTLFVPDQEPLAARKQWLASHLQTRGALTLDEGAARALRASGKSLLPVGVVAVAGDFSRGEMVVCRDPSGIEVARGLVNYAADEARLICGRASRDIEAALGYVDEPELIHRDNMVVTV
ncbi:MULTISPECIES: glutamate 5-kinase [unclassified Halorhodospira]|uniref:glutamate 5-kinase n=1 Tax=unclassified Halorhodospira TaxID=2626748 RepID=UPI001EE7FA2A|nr:MULTISPECIES: glutamate 5-kinase [unclassified Halorhodospira]MCG5539890.1 glutamate 5-kinase [Halorhodospira sp. M39old]MCG5545274.1 glutamate 5-kinase [Halorhodospira sp. M38]